MTFRRKVKPYVATPFTHHMVMEALAEYKRPNDKISELVKKGELTSVRRGLYIPGPEADLPIPDLFLIANHLRGPSYVSLETALAYWGMIPERTYEISSATLKTTKLYVTETGRFSYKKLPVPYYSFGIQSVEIAPQQVALIASKEKALCDKIVLSPGVLLRSVAQTRDFLIEDMRIDEDTLAELRTDVISSWIADAPKKNSLSMLVKTLETL